MAKHSMICHPDTPAKSVVGFAVEIERRADGLIWLRYHVECPIDALELGEPKAAVRTDGLWQTTCFELFFKVAGDPSYLEFNFAPSGEWAAFRFDDYRQGKSDWPLAIQAETGNDASDTYFALEAIVRVPHEFQNRELQVAVSAVLEEACAIKSYWALAHTQGPPDFHHPDCFQLTLPAPASI